MEERFWSSVEKFLDGCWTWKRALDGKGYGSFYKSSKEPGRLAHRVAWELVYGPIPIGMYVLHKCDNPPCVRPDHLFLGTQKQNVEDRTSKGRSAKGEKNGKNTRPEMRTFGETHPSAKLDSDMVIDIRESYRSGLVTLQELGDHYGVTRQTIYSIVHYKTWQYVD